MHLELALQRYRNGRMVEKRRQRGRSFMIGMMQLLYLAHAQIQYSAPYHLTDILGQARETDSYSYDTYVRNYKGTLALVGPGGNGSLFIPTGSVKLYDSTHPFQTWEPLNFLKGDILGIQVGADNTAVTPSDAHLGQKIFHGVNAAIAGPASFSEKTAGDTTSIAIDSATDKIGCLLFPKRGFRMSAVRLLLYKSGNPGNMTLTIRGVRHANDDGGDWLDAEPTGNIDSIVSNADTLPVGAPYEWREFTLTTPIDMQPGMAYAFVLECATAAVGNAVYWRYADLAGSAPVENWARMFTSDGESSWSTGSNYVMMIEPRGSALAETEYGGCEMFGKVVSNPNGEFSISRLFRNNSGGAISVAEVALYAAVTRYQSVTYNGAPSYKEGDAWAVCVARDVVSPAVNVLNAEILQVVYTPQITV
jgi:hypothetical protein